jgi:hypothetical protein
MAYRHLLWRYWRLQLDHSSWRTRDQSCHGVAPTVLEKPSKVSANSRPRKMTQPSGKGLRCGNPIACNCGALGRARAKVVPKPDIAIVMLAANPWVVWAKKHDEGIDQGLVVRAEGARCTRQQNLVRFPRMLTSQRRTILVVV